MSTSPLRVLVLESPSAPRRLADRLADVEPLRLELVEAHSAAEADACLERGGFDVAVCDGVHAGWAPGARDRSPEVAIVVVEGDGDEGANGAGRGAREVVLATRTETLVLLQAMALAVERRMPLRGAGGSPSRSERRETVVEQSGTERLGRARDPERERQSRRMDAIGRIAASVVHDFNNLLTAMLGYGEQALSKLEGHPAWNDVHQIQRAAEHATSFSHRLLAFSRNQALEPEAVDVNARISDLTQMLERLLGETIELELRLGADAGFVRVAPGQIEQIVVNLAINARDAMPNGGCLRIETSGIRPEAARDGRKAEAASSGFVRLRVTDSGIGMDVQTVGRAFEPFFSTKSDGEGTGLGLATVRDIVSECGGELRLESAPGEGARFDILLPSGPSSSAPVEGREEESPGAWRGTETILIAEDEQAVLDLTRMILEQHGYRLLTARDGAEAVELADAYEGPIHIMVADVVMPRMGGVEAAARLRARRPECRVLFLSGYAGRPRETSERASFASDWLAKPFTVAALCGKVRNLLDKRP